MRCLFIAHTLHTRSRCPLRWDHAGMCHVEVIPRGRHRREPQRFHASLPPAPVDGKHAARPRVKKQEGGVVVNNHGWQYHSDSEEELEVIDIDSDEKSPEVEAVQEAEAATKLSKKALADWSVPINWHWVPVEEIN